MKKFLVIRFSSIGDIVLTTPVMRSLKQSFPGCEVHYLTKARFAALLQHNPHVDQLFLMKDSLSEVLPSLKAERYDFIFDLHHNLRSFRAKLSLGRPSATFHKANLAKALLTHPWLRPLVPPIEHVVIRYGRTLQAVGAQPDDGGLDFFLPKPVEEEAGRIVQKTFPASPPLAVVLGATYPTKRWLPEHFVTLLNSLAWPVLLLGGEDAREEARQIVAQLRVPVLDAVGRYDLLTAAALMKQARAVLTHDTGFMHIAAAFGMKVFSLWGNTVPELGMYPYHTPSHILEVEGLRCRPCSKLGKARCPKGHFRCMRDLSPDKVEASLRENLGDKA